MRKILSVLLVCFFILIAVTDARAADIPASEESIRELMGLTQSTKMIDELFQNIESSMQTSMRQTFAGQALSEKQERILSEIGAEIVAELKETMSPEALEPMYIEIYRNTLTQSEVDGMIAFYKTDAGRALIAKMPLIAKQAMEVMQRRMQAMVPKLQQMQQEMMERLKEGK